MDGLRAFRGPRLFPAVREALARASKPHFRLVEFSVQSHHLHLLVEADGREPLIRGVQGLAIRTARAINRALGRRGKVWGDRYHARALTTPREVRHALVYVLQNVKKHAPGSGASTAARRGRGSPGGGPSGRARHPASGTRSWRRRPGSSARGGSATG